MNRYLNKIKNIPRRIYRALESRAYRNGKYRGRIRILSPEQTLEKLSEKDRCFCRFGDGEIAIMIGDAIPFQIKDNDLAERLLRILRSDDAEFLVGIGYCYLYPAKGVNGFTRNFLNCIQMQRKFLLKNCNKNRLYIDTAITQIYQNYEDYDFDMHFAKIQSLFAGRRVTLICGESVLKEIKYNALDVCSDVQYIYGPSKNAYNEYDNILKMALSIDKSRIICVILGPAAKVLIYDLYKNGRTAWDIGHYLKDYDSYMRRQPRTNEAIEEFFKPD